MKYEDSKVKGIGKKTLIPYFILGFALVGYSGINTIGAAVIGVCVALLQATFMQRGEVKMDTDHSSDDIEGGDF